jgi:putative hydrolase of the HAD superfamily
MLREMLFVAIQSRNVEFVDVLRSYRRIRETLAEALYEDFEQELVSRTAALVGRSEAQVRSTAEEWLERRPLRHVHRYRYAHIPELFQGLRRNGKQIGVFSDYPAQTKLDALELNADVIVCAGDADIRVLKPHARGLLVLMARANSTPDETLMIGDRPERDGLAAQTANVRSLIRSSKSIVGWQTFNRYNDATFATVAG